MTRTFLTTVAVLATLAAPAAATPPTTAARVIAENFRRAQLRGAMERAHGWESPLYAARIELAKDAPDWTIVARDAKAVDAVAEALTAYAYPMTYTSRSPYWYGVRYGDLGDALGQAVLGKDRPAASQTVMSLLHTCNRCHDRPPAFTRAGDPNKPVVLTNKVKDITVVSDRDETIPQFFQRQPVALAHVLQADLKPLAAGKGTVKKVFVDGTNTNDDPPEVRFGSMVYLAAPTAEVTKLIADHVKSNPDRALTVIFVPDPDDEVLFRPVGVTAREPWFFFEPNRKRPPGDDFTPADLIRKKPNKPK